MKKRIIIALSVMTLSTGIATALLWPKDTVCMDCPVGEKCFSDFSCNTAFCNLRCVQVDRAGFDKRCLIVR